MVKIISFLLLCLLPFLTNAQWVEQNSGVTSILRSVFFINAETGWASGDDGNILFTSDGGQNWVNQTPAATGTLNDIHFRNENSGACVGNGGYFTTGNAGQTWGFTQVSGVNIKTIHYSNDTTRWMGGDNKYLLRSSPSGSTTINLENPIFNWEVIDITSAENMVFVLVLFNNNSFYLYKSNDDFNTWTKNFLSSNTLNNKTRLFFLNENLGWIGGAFRFSSLIFPQLDKVINLGDSVATIFRPGFGSGFSHGMLSLYFINENVGWMSNNFTIFKTTDGGINWYSTQGADKRIFDITFIDENVGYAVGIDGKIYKTTNGGGPLTSIEGEDIVVKDFTLNQNYPNPFNPTTTISYQLPFTSQVSLKIYDVLGNEIADLVNDVKEAGRHEVNFNATSVSSGVYFYRLDAAPVESKENKFSSVRKMILMK